MVNNLDTEEYCRILEENVELGRIHQSFFQQWKAEILPRPSIQWHGHIDDIDKDILAQGLSKKLAEESFTVLPPVDLDRLLDKMSKEGGRFYRKKILYERDGDRNTTMVLRHWYNGDKLIPPVVMVYNRLLLDIIAPTGIPSRVLRPVDGKHRLNIAYYYGIESIPIVVWNKQIDLIMKILKK